MPCASASIHWKLHPCQILSHAQILNFMRRKYTDIYTSALFTVVYREPMLLVALYTIIILISVPVLIGQIYRKIKSPRKNVRAMIVLGSGGHTAEILTLLERFNLEKYTPRQYVVAVTDSLSAKKATAFEQSSGQQHAFSIVTIPRSREVGQSFVSSVATTLYALLYAVHAVFVFRPDLLMLNGPGTGLPVVLGAVLARLIGIASTKVVYVESVARVTRLSLTGKLIYWLFLSDKFFVQWEDLKTAYPRTIYAGRLT